MSNSSPALNQIQEVKKPWEQITAEERVIIISHEGDDVARIKKQLSCASDDEKTCPWHFGLIATHLKFSSPRKIDLRTLVTAASSLPYWLTLKNERSAENCAIIVQSYEEISVYVSVEIFASLWHAQWSERILLFTSTFVDKWRMESMYCNYHGSNQR